MFCVLEAGTQDDAVSFVEHVQSIYHDATRQRLVSIYLFCYVPLHTHMHTTSSSSSLTLVHCA